MDAFIEWQGTWVGWVAFAWVGYAFVLSLLVSTIVSTPERRAPWRAEGGRRPPSGPAAAVPVDAAVWRARCALAAPG